MLKTVAVSSNSKTGPIAVTYRAGTDSVYGTCPATCGLCPEASAGTGTVDEDYMEALLHAVPRKGIAWTYSHFPAEMLPVPSKGCTVINASCDTVREAVSAHKAGRPAVFAAPVGLAVPKVVDGVRFVQCPAELSDTFTCAHCGDGSPLCARGGRNFVVVFNAHGTGKKRVGTGTGGCYAASGPTTIQWHKTRTGGAANDAEALLAFAKSLPPGTYLRHHVAGDMGQEGALC